MFNDNTDFDSANGEPVEVGTLYDINGDGIADYSSFETAYDLDGDGILDTFTEIIDSNLDGIADYQHNFYDTDGNSMIDTESVSIDQDYDGVFDVQQVFNDLNGDGITDGFTQYTYTDSNDDGYIDTIVFAQDTNADGYFDIFNVSQDLDMDGIFDMIVSSQSLFDNPTDITTDPSAIVVDSSGEADVDNYDPSATDEEHVIGDPEESMEAWHVQETDSSCAVCSQEFVLEDLLDDKFEEADLREIAMENGWYDENGTSPENVGKLLEYFGLDVDRHESGTINEIEQTLANGGSVIVGVDAGELWYNQDNVYAPGDDANHAVEVIGIDYSDPDEPMVILNDSGIENGAGSMIPLDQFISAWEDSNNFIVVATENE
jgi:hypothetical protein